MRSAARFNVRWGQVAAFLLAVALAAGLAPGQSGRGRSDEKRQRPVKPVPPAPLPAPPGGPQAPKAETIRINSDLVTVIVSVSGGAGALGESDFEVLEDGVPQTISNFARDVQVPLRLVMLFDTSMSVAPRLGFERRAAARFLERVLRPQDRAALFAFATEVAVLQEFTNQVPLLVNAMRQLHARGATSLYDAIYLASDYIRAAPGRRVVIIVSDGGDTTSAKPLQQALAAAQQADAMIFAVFTGYQASQNLRDLAAERALGTLTGETGGEVYYPRVTPGLHGEEVDELSLNELDAAFARLAEQLRTQYTLGYYSTNDARDGGFRKLAVRVKQPGYATRARAGYYAPKG